MAQETMEILHTEIRPLEDADERTFENGGRPRGKHDLQKIGFDLEKAIDPDERRPDGSYAPLSEAKKDKIYAAALRWWWVWSRDARTPETSRLL